MTQYNHKLSDLVYDRTYILNIFICPIAIAYSMGGITRNSISSVDEIANVNFLYDDIVHALKIQ